MGLFNRKKKISPPIIEAPKHEHIWKDMPWYMTTEYNGKERTAACKIIEPYICISCGERKDKILEGHSFSNISPDARDQEFEIMYKTYKPYLKPRAVVEDMINDILLVKDAGRLQMIEKMRGTPHSGVGTSSKTLKNNNDEDEFRILLERREKNAD